MSVSRTRRIARALLQHAAKVVPQSRSDWGEAMAGELDQFTDDRAALDWAVGCTLTAYSERIRAMGTSSIARWIGANLIGVHAVGTLLAVNVAIWLNVQSPQTLLAPGGGLDPSALGLAYPEFLPSFLSTPLAAIVLWGAAGCLYVSAIWSFLARQADARTLFLAALAFDLFNVLVQRILPQASQTVYVGDVRLATTVILLLPAAGLLFLSKQESRTPQSVHEG